MAIYKFRISFEDYDDVTRDIEILPSQSFDKLHESIIKSINFDTSEQGHFFETDDYWRKGKELVAGNLDKGKLVNFMEDPHQKFIYEYGESGKWSIYIELLKIMPDESGNEYPKCTKSVGKAPAQYLKTIADISDEDSKFNGISGEEDIDDAAFYKNPEEAEVGLFDDEEKEIKEGFEEEDGMEENEEEDEFGSNEFSDNENLEEY